jgi:hypothetical protein
MEGMCIGACSSRKEEDPYVLTHVYAPPMNIGSRALGIYNARKREPKGSSAMTANKFLTAVQSEEVWQRQ